MRTTGQLVAFSSGDHGRWPILPQMVAYVHAYVGSTHWTQWAIKKKRKGKRRRKWWWQLEVGRSGGLGGVKVGK